MHRLVLSSASHTTSRPCITNAPKVFTRARSVVRKPRPSARSHAVNSLKLASPKRRIPSIVHNESRDDQSTAEKLVKELILREARRTRVFSTSELLNYMANSVDNWSRQSGVRQRYSTYGIPVQDIPQLFTRFVRAVKSRRVLEDLSWLPPEKERLAHDLSALSASALPDEHFSRLFFEWAACPKTQDQLRGTVSEGALQRIAELYNAADLSAPADRTAWTRSTPRRKVIMHVGPTNSGKTYNALRALAAAERGLYAGPLRLLAHEIFERLNKGQIIPRGVDPPPTIEADEDTNLEVADKPVLQKEGNPQYARVCNLVTGEEKRILDEEAGLTSCTVEMISQEVERLQVAVVDEIQMISDPERGHAWTEAVLGINADELHLCGEERAVPLIEAMLKDTGDELIVHRYERLTPLQVADTSLERNFEKIEKGDCLVTFSRRDIFKLKAQVEKDSGLKSAVVYGALPPEIRSSQAAKFNKPDSGIDVIIASDAIGMGLNLKIKRIIFQAVVKHNGITEELLSLSSFKQIAGRAGRFVLNGKNPPGIVTAMGDANLPVIRKALELPIEPLRYARLSPVREVFAGVAGVLPSQTPLNVVLSVFKYVSKLHPCYELEYIDKKAEHLGYIDSVAGSLTIEDRLLLLMAPVGWRDQVVLRAVAHMMKMYSNDLYVDYKQVVRHCDFQTLLDDVTALMASGANQVADDRLLQGLESMHKTLTMYVWLSFRLPVAYPDRAEVEKLLDQVEAGMIWCLDRMNYEGTNDKGTRSVQTDVARLPSQRKISGKHLAFGRGYIGGGGEVLPGFSMARRAVRAA